MGKPQAWSCPTCGRDTTIVDADRCSDTMSLAAATGVADGEGFYLMAHLVRCPNLACKQSSLSVNAFHGKATSTTHSPWFQVLPDFQRRAGIGHFQFLPTAAKPLSDTVPAAVQQDYVEACLILQLSPKAAATLARRALQGMVRDFWSISKPRLADELLAIKDKCDADLYKAMTSLKSIGNIGAHPERDIALIVDIEPDEAQQLVDLIHLLDAEWYVARAKKQQRLAALHQLGQQKKIEQQAGKADSAG